ncbi:MULTISPECIES: ferritin-like domain-containing protein [unclassified Haladaptatus]|uniref:ferritin-like domain-containing protein n=1 Tax=unclassified Haladaptatus TaxID=2622732 RepID=UPI0023E76349|nr:MULTISPECIES: ferritin-like domain-containing protein [unclassified Haladaptatus]
MATNPAENDGVSAMQHAISAVNDRLTSRRDFLTKGTAAGVVLLGMGGSAVGTAGAQEEDEDAPTDVDVLNFALTLEHLEDVFYRRGVEQFCSTDFERCKTLNGFSARVRKDVYNNIVDIGDHESTHTEVLTQVITDLGGDPVPELEYEFGFETPEEFLAIAQVLENTGVSAYDGAINKIENKELVTAGATIATVEARHASYLNLLNGADPFPAAFDEAKSKDEILEAAGGFIVQE